MNLDANLEELIFLLFADYYQHHLSFFVPNGVLLALILGGNHLSKGTFGSQVFHGNGRFSINQESHVWMLPVPHGKSTVRQGRSQKIWFWRASIKKIKKKKSFLGAQVNSGIKFTKNIRGLLRILEGPWPSPLGLPWLRPCGPLLGLHTSSVILFSVNDGFPRSALLPGATEGKTDVP